MSPTRSLAVTLLVALSQHASAQQPADVVRINEAFRLTAAIQDSVWPGGWGTTPFPLLLVTDDREYLVAFPRTPAGFSASAVRGLPTQVLQRPRQFETKLLATFPAFGPPSVIVVGRPESTGKKSTPWVLTIVHERFHEFQNADTSYYPDVARLDLSGDDQSGMWMLNYPFPYKDSSVAGAFADLSRQLARLLDKSTPGERRELWPSYERFLAGLSPRDRRYLGFQLWQEGVARYVELRAAEIAARGYVPSDAFKALPDFEPFSAVAARMRSAIIDELQHPDLAARQRVSFYAFGAGLALLLDRDAPGWQRRYLREKFAVERYPDR